MLQRQVVPDKFVRLHVKEFFQKVTLYNSLLKQDSPTGDETQVWTSS